MNRRIALAASGAVIALATGCGAQHPAAHQAASTPARPMADMPMADMPMADMPMAAPMTTAAAPEAAAPDAAAMVCSHETHRNVAMLAGDPSLRMGTASWRSPHYACSYRLAGGPFVLSVDVAPTRSAARQNFDALRHRLGAVDELHGLAALGLPAYETQSGVVVFLKGTSTLVVDARKLPASIGPQHHTRTDFAYTVATDVIACWNGD